MIRLVEQLQQLQEKKWKKWVETFEDEDTHEMVVTTEADNGDPLLYALRECFDNLEITMIETE